jgi:alkylmercury lyase
MSVPEPLDQRIRNVAFRELYRSGGPVTVERLAAAAGVDLAEAEAGVAESLRQGRIRLDGEGAVIGCWGLNVVADRHEIWLGERRLWTWCAVDALGILGAVGAGGRILSRSPVSGTPIEVRFTGGRPEPTPAVVFVADRPPDVVSIYEDWCSLVNLFADRAEATAWAEESGAAGEVDEVAPLTVRATESWRPLVDGLD